MSQDPAIKDVKHLYKIGFSTNSVEQRIANAENEPTYLMAPVKVQASYKVVNMNSQKFEDLIHQLLKPVQFQVSVFDEKGVEHQPQEWFVVPLPVVDIIIQKIMDGCIVGYTYNPQLECLEKRIVKEQTTLNKYTYVDEADGKRYLRRYDALRLFVGYHKDRESALVQVKDITYNNGVVEYHLGLILEVINNMFLLTSTKP